MDVKTLTTRQREAWNQLKHTLAFCNQQATMAGYRRDQEDEDAFTYAGNFVFTALHRFEVAHGQAQ